MLRRWVPGVSFGPHHPAASARLPRIRRLPTRDTNYLRRDGDKYGKARRAVATFLSNKKQEEEEGPESCVKMGFLCYRRS
jgi:hypothetical protein